MSKVRVLRPRIGWSSLLRFAESGAELVRHRRLRLRSATSDLAPVRGVSAWPGTLRTTAVVLALIAGFGFLEARTSLVESRFFHALASRLTWSLAPGASTRIVFPQGGPYDRRSGYDRIPDLAARAEHAGYRVSSQAEWSSSLAALARLGLSPPYHEPSVPDLVIRSAQGRELFDGRAVESFRSYDEIPAFVTRALFYIENRRLGQSLDRHVNPAVDWGRFTWATMGWFGRRVGLPLRVEGGSTIAVQMEKYRHSLEGRTHGPGAKLMQIMSASLRVYRDSPVTDVAGQRITLDYLNSLPLAGARGHGEVEGLADGMRVWFGTDPEATWKVLKAGGHSPERTLALKRTLALLCSARAPTNYLIRDRAALVRRVDLYTDLLERDGVLDSETARDLRVEPLVFASSPTLAPVPPVGSDKTARLVRGWLLGQLGVERAYDLDRLDLEAQTTLDADLQDSVAHILRSFTDSSFVNANGLRGEHLLSSGDPAKVVYSFVLMENDSQGVRTAAYTDNLAQPFDLNRSMKMELGSTAKLRTLAHYLELVADLHAQLTGAAPVEDATAQPHDPLTTWAVATLHDHPGMPLEDFLQASMERKYSANPGEAFFTGGGLLSFHNFEPEDNRRILTLREATEHSTNLVFVRLMRDLVAYHVSRLPYDRRAVLADPADPDRVRMLQEIADEEGRLVLHRAWKRFHGLPPDSVERTLLGAAARTPRSLAVLYYAWQPEPDSAGLATWLQARLGESATPEVVGRMYDAYGRRPLTLEDCGFLLSRHPLDVWCAGAMARDSGAAWSQVLAAGDEARRQSQAWLFRTRNRHAQDLRLRTRIERDAFVRMTPSWRRLGFPFQRLVPSLGSAIGSSSDRPLALAELMGIIVSDGIRRPTRIVQRLVLGEGTPYQTVLERTPREQPERVMRPEIARVLRGTLAGVVERGTARRLLNAFAIPGRDTLVVGGKTGSGDNRFVTFNRGGGVRSSQAISRTAAFAFYIGDRWYGVVTASVTGPEAGQYRFTSALPLEVMRRLAPAIMDHVQRELPAPTLKSVGPPMLASAGPTAG